MNFDIRLAVGFWQHPKVRKLEKRLGLKGVRSLQILWCWCAQNRPDGNLAGLDAEDIDLAADWRGREGAFFEQCLGVWIDETDGAYQLHEWADYNPYQAQAGSREEARKQKARNAATVRWDKEKKGSPDNAESVQPHMQNDAVASQEHMQNDAVAYAKPMHGDATLTHTNTSIKNININTASPGGAAASPPRPQKKKEPPDGPYYQAKSGAYLAGETLAGFEAFWEAFDFRKGKAEAADAWLKIPDMTEALAARICGAARQEASNRAALEARGQTPKWAQGWLTSRRWEDYEPPKPRARPEPAGPRQLTPEEKERADATRRRLQEKWRQRESMPRPLDPAGELAGLAGLAATARRVHA